MAICDNWQKKKHCSLSPAGVWWVFWPKMAAVHHWGLPIDGGSGEFPPHHCKGFRKVLMIYLLSLSLLLSSISFKPIGYYRFRFWFRLSVPIPTSLKNGYVLDKIDNDNNFCHIFIIYCYSPCYHLLHSTIHPGEMEMEVEVRLMML